MFNYKSRSSFGGGTKNSLKYTGLRLGLFVLLVLGLAIAQFNTPSVAAKSSSTSSSTAPADQLIIKLVDEDYINAVNTSYGTRTVRALDKDGTYLVSANGQSLTNLLAQMSGDARLTSASINQPGGITNGTRISIYGQEGSALSDGGGTPWALAQATNQTAFNRMKLQSARLFSNGTGIKIAVLDTGVSATHPDLAGKLLSGYNFVNQSADTTDDNGHGTFIIGLIGMVAPGAKILPVKVLDAQGAGSVASLIQGINWSVDNGAKIINLSLGLYDDSKELENAIKRAKEKGVLMVASAGNDNSREEFYPASWDGVINVTGLDGSARKASFANYGERVKVSAVAVGLYSTYYRGGYATGNGTSFSAPLVTGEAALIWSLSPTLKTDDLYKVITDRSNSVESYNDRMYKNRLGKGEIDVFAALLSIKTGGR